MAFESLSDKLQNAFSKLKGKGVITESDINAAMREVKLALLEADVNFKVVKEFVAIVKEKCLGAEVLQSLTPAQQIIKIVNSELIDLMGGSGSKLTYSPSGFTVLMMVGLQGTGKTTTCGKLASFLKQSGKKPMLVACDIYRPAAIDQLEVVGKAVNTPVFTMRESKDPVQIALAAKEDAERKGFDVLIIDTAGRLQIDEDMMQELVDIKEAVEVTQTLLVVDAMTGQEAVNVATTFDSKIGIDGVVLTKLDGDTRGGAALSIRSVTGKPILYAGMGEKLSDLEQFYPDRMANRILGMGDILSLIDKAQSALDAEKAKELEQKFKKAEFDFNDMLSQFEQIQKLGSIKDILGMMPGGLGGKLDDAAVDEGALDKVKAIIFSMTKAERGNPNLLNPSRKHRIAKGAGVDVAEVNKLVKQMEQMKKVMKQMSGMMKGKGKKKFGLPFGL